MECTWTRNTNFLLHDRYTIKKNVFYDPYRIMIKKIL